jgi:hypothetical protein
LVARVDIDTCVAVGKASVGGIQVEFSLSKR